MYTAEVEGDSSSGKGRKRKERRERCLLAVTPFDCAFATYVFLRLLMLLFVKCQTGKVRRRRGGKEMDENGGKRKKEWALSCNP